MRLLLASIAFPSTQEIVFADDANNVTRRVDNRQAANFMLQHQFGRVNNRVARAPRLSPGGS